MLLIEGVGSPEATCEVMAMPREERVSIGTSGMHRHIWNEQAEVQPSRTKEPVCACGARGSASADSQVTQTIPKSHRKSLYRIHDTSLDLTTSLCGLRNVAKAMITGCSKRNRAVKSLSQAPEHRAGSRW